MIYRKCSHGVFKTPLLNDRQIWRTNNDLCSIASLRRCHMFFSRMCGWHLHQLKHLLVATQIGGATNRTFDTNLLSIAISKKSVKAMFYRSTLNRIARWSVEIGSSVSFVRKLATYRTVPCGSAIINHPTIEDCRVVSPSRGTSKNTDECKYFFFYNNRINISRMEMKVRLRCMQFLLLFLRRDVN